MQSWRLMLDVTSLTTIACWVCGARAQSDEHLGRDGYLRCERCGLRFQGGRTAGDAARLYDDEYFACCAGGGGYADDEAQRLYEARRRVRFLRRFIGGGRLLEIGSAGGHFLDRARSAGFRVRGIEPVSTMASDAATRHALDIEHGTLENTDLGREEWDVVCAFHVLEHLDDPMAALAKAHAALADRGLLLLEVPNITSVFARRYGSNWFNLQPTHHVAHYDPRSLRTALELSGYSVYSSSTVPHLEYMRMRSVLRRSNIKALAALTVASRRIPLGDHPDRHEFLRVAAVKESRRS